MKISFLKIIFAIFSLSVFVVLQPQVARADIATGLVSYYTFDDGTASDSAGSNNGTLVGSPTSGAGNIGQALNFNGSSNYVYIPSDFAVPNLTFSAWIKPSSVMGVHTIFADNDRFRLILNGTRLFCTLHTTSRNFSFCITQGSTSLVANTWYHVVLSYDGTTYRYYVNGVADGNNSTQYSGDLTGGNGLSCIASSCPGSSTPSNDFLGYIDDVRIYNRALSASDVAELYAYTGICPGTTPSGNYLSGWAWSSTIGWISFNSADSGANSGACGGPYSVSISSSGALSGYAWSPNIGWIQFGNLGGARVAGIRTTDATVNMTTGAVTGWIRAVAGVGRTDGWDGWIELSGGNHPTIGGNAPVAAPGNTSPGGGAGAPGGGAPSAPNTYNNYAADANGNSLRGVAFNPTTGAFSGYAWGSDVVGWVDFKGVTTSATTTALPVVINPVHPTVGGTSATLGATVTSLGTPPVSASTSGEGIGVVLYSTTHNPTASDNPATFGNPYFYSSVVSGPFTLPPVLGLNAGTTYYFRGFARNSVGTGYSTEGTFTTPGGTCQDPASVGGVGSPLPCTYNTCQDPASIGGVGSPLPCTYAGGTPVAGVCSAPGQPQIHYNCFVGTSSNHQNFPSKVTWDCVSSSTPPGATAHCSEQKGPGFIEN